MFLSRIGKLRLLFDLRPGAWVALLSISLVLASCGVLGVSYVSGQGWPVLDGFATVALIAVWTIVSALLLLLFDAGFFRLSARAASEAASEKDRAEGTDKDSDAASHASHASWHRGLLRRLTPRYSRKSILLFSAIMALFWLPWLVANFPGGTYWDTYYQIFQCYPENHPIAVIPYKECYDNTLTDAYFCDHHPLFDTLVYGAFAISSDALTGTWLAGVFAFVCLQGAAYVAVFTTAVAYLRKCRCPLVLCFAAYAFFCLMPFVSTWSLCMVKDSFFTLFFIPYLMMLFSALRTRGASLQSMRSCVLFALLALLLCLTKKQGVFVAVPSALVAAWLLRPKSSLSSQAPPAVAPVLVRFGAPSPEAAAMCAVKVFLVQAFLCLCVVCLVLPFCVFPLLDVAPGGKQEVLGPLLQQTARYVTYHGEEVDEDEREAIDAVLEYDNLAEQYTFNFQDEVKYRFRLDATDEDILRYLKVWFEQGCKHPESYLAAIAGVAGYYVAPCGIVNIRMVTVDVHMGDDQRYVLYNPEGLDWLREGLDGIYHAIAYTPGVDLLLLMVVYVLWLPAALLFVSLRRCLRCGLLFVPLFILAAFCVIAPVNDARYCIPLFDTAPLLLCMMAVFLSEKINDRVQDDRVQDDEVQDDEVQDDEAQNDGRESGASDVSAAQLRYHARLASLRAANGMRRDTIDEKR